MFVSQLIKQNMSLWLDSCWTLINHGYSVGSGFIHAAATINIFDFI